LGKKILEAQYISKSFGDLKIVQDFDIADIPLCYRERYVRIDLESGRITNDEHEKSHQIRYRGSHCSSIGIRVRLGRVEVSGNPSRFNRVDNLFGYKTIDECVAVYNSILSKHFLPNFTKCTKVFHHQSKDGKRAFSSSDGAIIQEIHITSNRSVGEGNEEAYLKGLATLSYRNSVPKLHTNGCTVDWSSKLGNNRLIYPSVYKKSNEIGLHGLPKLKREYGSHSEEYKYLKDIQNYCAEQGVVRFEQKFKSEYLRRNNQSFYGLSDFDHFTRMHSDYVNLDSKLKVNSMDLETISEKLLREKICKSLVASDTTAYYTYKWMHGAVMDLNKKQVQTHRARLRKIGIDIGRPCDLTTFSPILVRKTQEIVVKDLPIPSWYKRPVSQLRLVA